MIDDDPLNWFCWVLVNGRNNWWYPEETGRDCAEAFDHATEEDIEREIAVHWAKFNAMDEAIADLGRALAQAGDGFPDDINGYQSRRGYAIGLVEERAQREVERSREHGLDLNYEPTWRELREETKKRMSNG